MKKKIIISVLILFLVVGIFCAYLVLAGSFNPEDERLIGYEFLDLEGNIVSPAQGEVVHIWNNASISNYFFNKSSGIQLTNHFQEYWTKNILCIGYYDGEEWNKIKCADELSNFNKDIQTDNQTYVNATLWKDLDYSGYNLRLGIKYHLGLDDETLSVTVYGKNLGEDIPYELGFVWKVTEVNIPSNESNDKILINFTSYPLNGTYNLLFKNMGVPFFRLYDSCKHLKIDWDENLSYAVEMYGNGNQEDFYVALLINAGIFNSGVEKSTTFYWIDAGTCSDTPSPCYEHTGDQWTCELCGCIYDFGDCFGSPDPCNWHTDLQDCTDCGCTWTEDPDDFYINVGDTWQLADAVYVNVGDVWQDVEAVYVNVGDSWRLIFNI